MRKLARLVRSYMSLCHWCVIPLSIYVLFLRTLPEQAPSDHTVKSLSAIWNLFYIRVLVKHHCTFLTSYLAHILLRQITEPHHSPCFNTYHQYNHHHLRQSLVVRLLANTMGNPSRTSRQVFHGPPFIVLLITAHPCPPLLSPSPSSRPRHPFPLQSHNHDHSTSCPTLRPRNQGHVLSHCASGS